MISISVPTRTVNGEIWGALSFLSTGPFLVCAEKVELVKEAFSFADGHRVRLYKFRKNVHFRAISDSLTLDVSAVPVEIPPRRVVRAHHKK